MAPARRGAVDRNDRLDLWALSRYADVEAAHRDPATFMSSHGVVREMMTPEPAPSGMMVMQDPPDHTRLRSMAARAFTPRRVLGLGPCRGEGGAQPSRSQ